MSRNPTEQPLAEGDEGLDFHHPYTPYDVQLRFMKTVYDTLERGDGQVGILESPTGTGKSLSLICAALTWLRRHKKNKFESSITLAAQGIKDEPDWLIQQVLHGKREEMLRKWNMREERLAKIRAMERAMEERGSKRRRLGEPMLTGKKTLDGEAEFLLDDWSGGDDVSQDDPLSLFSKETRALMEKVGMGNLGELAEDEGELDNEIKIFYTSRTHSQLAQFILELRRPTFPSSVPTSLSSAQNEHEKSGEAVKLIPLSSRQKLCINPSVSRLGSLAAINDRCAELQQPKTKDSCPFVPNAENLTQTHLFRDTALATLPDIEDVHELGKTLHVCPYYASRTAINGAEIITLPYPLLLQKSAREALGIKLEGNVVIIDEAHNIMDAVANVHAAEIGLGDLKRGHQMLGVYVQRFGKKLKEENKVMVRHVRKVIESLTEWMEEALKSKSHQGIVDPNGLLTGRGADQINIFKLINYIQESKLAYKVESYMAHTEEQENTNPSRPKSSTPVLHMLVSFLMSLTNLSTEGRVFFEKAAMPPGSPPDIKLSYMLLSPTHAFSSIASDARAVLLAGGTMSPFDDYKAHLFPSHSDEKITTLSCGHVIPSSNLCVLTLASIRQSSLASRVVAGAVTSGDVFEFSFQKRSDRIMIRQLGIALLNICSVVPDGVVVFFPSYGYLDEIVKAWQVVDPAQDRGGKAMWDRLQAKKAVFRDTKETSSEEVLAEFSAAILGKDGSKSTGQEANAPLQQGALLLSVVGGRMSEGINFSDRLGRCVVIVGLPYPNINSPEWKARMEYIESTTLARLTAHPLPGTSSNSPVTTTAVSSSLENRITREQALPLAKQAARDFYENACMRAVNQSIGRAIRHRGDYAAIILVDQRFAAERIRGKLPGWIREAMILGSEDKGVQGMMGALSGFFRGRKDTDKKA